MHAGLSERFAGDDRAREAADLLARCVHCGFCNATCPTYQIRGDELDGPRGRIWLLRDLLETGEATERTMTHLDRCLTCRSCETTCPSGVEYGKLLDIGRELTEPMFDRPLVTRLVRRFLLHVVPYPWRFVPLFRLGQAFRFVLPRRLRELVPPREKTPSRSRVIQDRWVVLAQGCVQDSLAPATNRAASRVLHRLRIETIPVAGQACCGALPRHLGEVERSRHLARRNIDAWWPYLEAGAEAIVQCASGCSIQLKDYGQLLADDPDYTERAAAVAAKAWDLAEFLEREPVEQLGHAPEGKRSAVHVPCTLFHGQRLPGTVAGILDRVGFSLCQTANPWRCCGSAGTYSVLQPTLSRELRDRKIADLTIDEPDQIVTANVGCHVHLKSGADIPVRHWVELLDEL